MISPLIYDAFYDLSVCLSAAARVEYTEVAGAINETLLVYMFNSRCYGLLILFFVRSFVFVGLVHRGDRKSVV